MSLRDVDTVHSGAVEAKINPVLVCLLTELASKRFLTGMGA